MTKLVGVRFEAIKHGTPFAQRFTDLLSAIGVDFTYPPGKPTFFQQAFVMQDKMDKMSTEILFGAWYPI